MDAIRKANDLIYSQTDKMKQLKSQKLYADVIATRYEQIDYKQKLKEDERLVDASYHQKTLAEVERLEAVEKAKLAKTQKLVTEIKIKRFDQLDDVRARKEMTEKLEREDGLRMKEKAIASLDAEWKQLEEKKKIAAANNLRMLKANSDLKGIREKMLEAERAAEAERDAEVEVIEARKIALKRLEKERFEKSQLSRQAMIDAAVEQLARTAHVGNAILEKQVQDLKDKEDRKFADKAAMQEQNYAETVASRTAQVEAKKAKLALQKIEDDRLVAKWKRENEEGIEREKEKVIKAHAATVACKATQKADGEAVARKREEDRQREIEQTRFLQSIDVGDEGRFIELCQAEIERNIKAGKPVYTLLRALEYSTPKLLPAKTIPVDRTKLGKDREG